MKWLFIVMIPLMIPFFIGGFLIFSLILLLEKLFKWDECCGLCWKRKTLNKNGFCCTHCEEVWRAIEDRGWYV